MEGARGQPILVPRPGLPRPMQRPQEAAGDGLGLASPLSSMLQLHHQYQQQQQQPTKPLAIPLPRYPCSAPGGSGMRRLASSSSHKRVHFIDEPSPTDCDEQLGCSFGSAPKRLCSFLEEGVREANARLARISCSSNEPLEPPLSALPGTASAIQSQVRLLSCSSDEAVVAAAIRQLARLFAAVPPARQEQVATASGGIRALVLSTSSRSGNSCCGATSVQLAAAQALAGLASASPAYQTAVSAAGGVKLLVELVARGARGSGCSLAAGEVAEAAAAGLVGVTMCGHPGGIAATVAAGGVAALVAAAAGSHPGLRLEAARALCNISSGPTQHRSAIADAGGIAALVGLLSSSSSSSSGSSREVQYAAVNTLDSLAVYSPAHKRAISDAGAIKAAVQLLRSISSSDSSGGSSSSSGSSSEAGLAAALQEACAAFLETLVIRSPANLVAVEAAGGIRLLQQLVRRCNSIAGACLAGSSVSSSLGGIVVADEATEGVREAAVSALRRMNAVIPLN